jgi:uncharacterized surface protein with fasciclin (FAS1) repeats
MTRSISWFSITAASKLAAATTLALGLAACGDTNHPASITSIASNNPNLKSLTAALAFASDNNDLVNTLNNAGTFTVFAPTDAAFDALAVELLGAGKKASDLLVPANKALVRTVLQGHVLASKVEAAQVPISKPIDPIAAGTTDIFYVDTIAGALSAVDGRNRVSKITQTNVQASNGVVHVIDKVLLPADKNIVQTAQGIGDFSILVEAVVAANLAGTLSGAGPFTVFAPTNAAFAAALTELGITKDALFANTALLSKILTYHVVSGRVLKGDVPIGTAVATVQGETLTVGSDLKITDQRARKAGITNTNVMTSNGVIHVIDKVILPKP